MLMVLGGTMRDLCPARSKLVCRRKVLFLIDFLIGLQLQREYDRLLPSLKELLKQEPNIGKGSRKTKQGFGVSQAFETWKRTIE